MTQSPHLPSGADLLNDGRTEFKHFLEQLSKRVSDYLKLRPDGQEQSDHLRHVSDRARWIYYSELQREAPGAIVSISPHESDLIEACVFSHDIGKWIPRNELKTLLPVDAEAMAPTFQVLKFTPNQNELFLLGIRRRLALEQDGYTPEYDSAHHLVSAYILATDESLGFVYLNHADQERLIDMIVGHQFGGYFKESLLNLSMRDMEVTTGMLIDLTRPERVMGDPLASAFHDADISDLLFVGSLERRPNREEIFHAGGLIKILLINLTNRINRVPFAPTNLEECLRSCRGTVTNASKEFLTRTAITHGQKWRKQARRFLNLFMERPLFDKFSEILEADDRPTAERLNAARMLAYLQAREFIKRDDEEE